MYCIEFRAVKSKFLFESFAGSLKECNDKVLKYRSEKVRDWVATITGPDGRKVIEFKG